MHYFVIHSGDDFEDVQSLIDKWSAEFARLRCSVLKGTKSDWHDDARAEIRGADKVIYIVGKTSGANENIDWELGVALEEGKEIYVYKLKEEYALNKVLENNKRRAEVHKGEKDGELIFSQNKRKVFVTDDRQLHSKFSDDDEYISSHLETEQKKDDGVVLKQYEMFVETSEELVRRKQTVNSFYITLNSVIIGVVLAAFAVTQEVEVFGHSVSFASLIICMTSLMGGIVCFSWYSVLQSYADLNSSKMKIISYIETQLAYNLYHTEWQLVSKRMGNRKYKSFSKKEMFIAKLFLAFYAALLVAGVILNFS